jgi:hypothetical protein
MGVPRSRRTSMIRKTTAVFAVLALFAAACSTAGADAIAAPDADPAAGMCLEGTPDCVDTDLDGDQLPSPEDPAAIDEGAMIREAEGLLGEVEEDVLERWPTARVGSRGGEHMMLTEDYVIGRMTIATEDDGTGTYRVVEVSLELTDGPQVLTGN